MSLLDLCNVVVGKVELTGDAMFVESIEFEHVR